MKSLYDEADTSSSVLNNPATLNTETTSFQIWYCCCWLFVSPFFVLGLVSWIGLLLIYHGLSFKLFFSFLHLSVLRLRRIFYPRFYPLHLFSYLNSWDGASIFPFECSVLNTGTTGTIFITSLVWRGPWLGIEPGTSHTRSQDPITRLSRRRSPLSIDYKHFRRNFRIANIFLEYLQLLDLYLGRVSN